MKQNEHELEKLRELAQQLRVDRFTVKTLNPSCGLAYLDQELLPDNPQYRRYQYRPGTYERIRIDPVCRRVWTMSNILSNGDVVPCCYDYNSELKVGNVRDEPLSKLWNGPAYRELRKRIYYQKDTIDKCRECTINFKLSDSGWFVESLIFNQDGQARLLKKILGSRCLQTPAMQKIKKELRKNKWGEALYKYVNS